MNILTPSGRLTMKKIHGFNYRTWKIRNALRLGFILGWIQVHLALLLGRLLGVAVITSELPVAYKFPAQF